MVRKLKGAKPAGNQADIVKQAQVMQQQMLEIQEQLKSKEVSSSVGGGAVSVKVNGQKELVEVKLSDEIVKEAATDKEMLEDLILTAVKNAMAEAEEMAEKEMAKVTGGINIPVAGRAGTKVGTSDPAVRCGTAVAQRIKGLNLMVIWPSTTILIRIRCYQI